MQPTAAISTPKSFIASIGSLIGLTAGLGGKLKTFSQGILKGVSFGLGLFKK